MQLIQHLQDSFLSQRSSSEPLVRRGLRSSSIELLRILAMFMIVSHHIVTHTIIPQMQNAESIARLGNGFFNHPLFYKRLLPIYSFVPLGKIGVAIFILISGYFMVKRGRSVSLGRIGVRLFGQFLFASLCLLFLSFALYRWLGHGHIPVGMRTIQHFNNNSWFLGFYFLIILIGALFLNEWLLKLGQRQYLTFLLVLFALCQSNWIGAMEEGLATGLRVLITGLLLYSLGGYLDLYRPLDSIRLWVFLLLIAFCYLCIYLSNYNLMAQKIQDYTQASSKEVFYQTFITWTDYNLPILLIALALFEIFRRLPTFQCSVINFLASSTFMIYLIHDNPLAYSLWNRTDWIRLLYQNPPLFCLQLLRSTLASMLAGLVLYLIYRSLCFLQKYLRPFVIRKN